MWKLLVETRNDDYLHLFLFNLLSFVVTSREENKSVFQFSASVT